MLGLLALAVGLALAQPHLPVGAGDEWERWDAGLPSTAMTLALAGAPEHPGVLYAGTYAVPGLWRSTDDGATWYAEPSPAAPVYALLWDAFRQRWWAGTGRGLYFRDARASEWRAVPELARAIFHLALDESGRVYAVVAEQGLWRLDAADGWTCLRAETRASVVGVAGTETIFLGTGGAGLWQSRDDGATWSADESLREAYIPALLVDAQTARVYLSTLNETWMSEDSGRTWQAMTGWRGHAFTFALTPDGRLFAGARGEIAQSSDAGRTWNVSRQGLRPAAEVLEIVATKDRLLAATRDGVRVSDADGRSWQPYGNGFDISVNALTLDGAGGILAATPLGLYRRARGSDRWSLADAAFAHQYFYDLTYDADARTLYAGTEEGLWQSADGGKTWKVATGDWSARTITGVAVDPRDSKHWVIRLVNERIYESHDAGATWHARWAGMTLYDVVLSMAFAPSGELFAGNQAGLFRWEASANRWTPTALMDRSIYAIAFDPTGRTQYVGGSDGLWRAATQGDWQRVAPDVIRNTVTALAVLPDRHLYVGTRYGGLYRSCDAGETWHRVTAIPADATINDLLAEVEAGVVYAATDRGMYRGQDTACAAPARPGRDVWLEHLAGWRERLAWLRQVGRPQPLPAVHTLRADDALLRQAKDLGARALVQVFSWRDIEPVAGNWYWEFPDAVVRAAEFYNLALVVRLDQPPHWALEPPPFDADAYIRFVERVATRYRGRVAGYIVWNEPNLAREWNAPPDPAAYTRLLQRAYAAVKRADPDARVVSAGLASTNEVSVRALDDRIFLRRMYAAGAQGHFDALGAHPYGFAYPPDDPPRAHEGLNLNRILDLRAVMEAQRDHKPVWITEIGWTTQGVGEQAWLTVTPAQQADYLARAWRKTQAEFPWVSVFTVWNLSRGSSDRDEQAGYSILQSDGAPQPAYTKLRESWRGGLDVWAEVSARLPDASPIAVLAREVVVHLGDNE